MERARYIRDLVVVINIHDAEVDDSKRSKRVSTVATRRSLGYLDFVSILFPKSYFLGVDKVLKIRESTTLFLICAGVGSCRHEKERDFTSRNKYHFIQDNLQLLIYFEFTLSFN
jgi:hypothetical protein